MACGTTRSTQVRGFADQSLRNPADPEDPSNRRITLIIQYQKATPEDIAKMIERATSDGGRGDGGNKDPKPSVASVAAQGKK